MEGGLLAMSQKERSRLVMMTRVREKAMTIREASEMVGVSYRQCRRIYKRYREEGDRGIIHRNRGRPSNRGKPHELKGKVLALYREQYWDFGPTLEEQLAGELPLTQFGRACQKLGIEIITANSPQAKGRVERKHGVYQDRWVKELQLVGIKDIEEANQCLCGFVESLKLNQGGNTSPLRIIPGEDTASIINASARHYRCEVTRGHF